MYVTRWDSVYKDTSYHEINVCVSLSACSVVLIEFNGEIILYFYFYMAYISSFYESKRDLERKEKINFLCYLQIYFLRTRFLLLFLPVFYTFLKRLEIL